MTDDHIAHASLHERAVNAAVGARELIKEYSNTKGRRPIENQEISDLIEMSRVFSALALTEATYMLIDRLDRLDGTSTDSPD